MAEYLYPGVYVTEVPIPSHPISGVSTSTSDIIGAETIAKIRRLIAQVPHGWVDANQHDPGIALLELSAWLTESLASHVERVPDDGARTLARVALASLALLGDRRQPADSTIARVSYFEGQILDEKDLSTEQDYQRCLKIGGKRDAKRPLETFTYQVFIDGVLAGGFQEVDGLPSARPTSLFETWIMRPLRKLLGLRKFTTIALKRGFAANRTLADWYRNIQASQADRRAVMITRTESSSRSEWRLKSAWPAKIEGPRLDATANDSAIESLELAHEGEIKVTPAGSG